MGVLGDFCQEYEYVFYDQESGEIKASNDENIIKTIQELNSNGEGWHYMRVRLIFEEV